MTQTTNGYLYLTDTTNINYYNGTSWSTIRCLTINNNFTGIAAFGNIFNY